jgi:hypothetical protein
VVAQEKHMKKPTQCALWEHPEILLDLDASGDNGEFGIGLMDGPLCDANEIEALLRRARLAWVQSVRVTGKPKAPQWIIKDQGLEDYFHALGRNFDGRPLKFDLRNYESDKEAADDLRAESDRELLHARDEFLDYALFKCGWPGDRTEREITIPMKSIKILSWWAFKPRDIVKKFRKRLQRILSEAHNG